MSLLLKMRTWLSLDDAITLAISEGLLAATSAITDRNSEQYAKLKEHLCLAYFDQEKCNTRLSINKPIFYWRRAHESSPPPLKLTAKLEPSSSINVDSSYGWLDQVGNEAISINFETSHNLNSAVAGLRAIDTYSKKTKEITQIHKAQTIYFVSGVGVEKDQTALQLLTWRDLVESELQTALEVHTETFLSFLQKVTPIEAHKPLPNAVGSKLTLNEDDLPPRTANIIYKEYKAMAITIAHLSGQKWGDYSELAAIVMSACEKADNDMPTEKRTVEKRINKA